MGTAHRSGRRAKGTGAHLEAVATTGGVKLSPKDFRVAYDGGSAQSALAYLYPAEEILRTINAVDTLSAVLRAKSVGLSLLPNRETEVPPLPKKRISYNAAGCWTASLARKFMPRCDVALTYEPSVRLTIADLD